MNSDQSIQPASKAELKEIILENHKEIERLNDEIRLLCRALFAPKSEKQAVGPSPQIPLFDIPENFPTEAEEEAPVEVPAHTRRKKRTQKTT